MKAQVAESGKWVCDNIRSERLREPEGKLQDALQQVDALTRKNKTLEEQQRLATAGREGSRSEKMQGHHKSGECLVLGGSIMCNVGTICSDMKFECFPGLRT